MNRRPFPKVKTEADQPPWEIKTEADQPLQAGVLRAGKYKGQRGHITRRHGAFLWVTLDKHPLCAGGAHNQAYQTLELGPFTEAEIRPAGLTRRPR